MKYVGPQSAAQDIATQQRPYVSLDDALTQMLATQWLMLAALAALLDDNNLTPASPSQTEATFLE